MKITTHLEYKQYKATRSLFPIKMITKPQMTQRNAQPKHGTNTEPPHHNRINNQQQMNRHLRTECSLSHWIAKMHFTGTCTKSSS